MSGPSDDLDSLWKETLQVLGTRGWQLAEAELIRKIKRADSLPKSKSASIDSLNLVLGTLQQKFGGLPSAVRSLSVAADSQDPATSTEARVRLAKVYSQTGDFARVHGELEQLLPARRSRASLELPPGLPASVLWRLGFARGMVGDLRSSRYWFERHGDATPGSHGSQLANNLTFSGLIQLLSGSHTANVLHDTDIRSMRGYLADGLSVANVKFLSIAKSVVVPMLIESVLLFSMKQMFDGLIQVLLCRRLLQYEGLTIRSEGIAEAIACLRHVDDTRLAIQVMKRLKTPEDSFISWLAAKVGSKDLVGRAIEEAEGRFSEFRSSGNYGRLWMIDGDFPSVVRGPAGSTAYFSWAGERACGIEIRLFLLEQVGLRVLSSDSPQFLGKSRAELVDEAVKISKVAIIHLLRSGGYEAGVFKSALGASRVIFLTTIDSDPLRELGLASIAVDERDPSACFGRLRQAILSALARE